MNEHIDINRPKNEKGVDSNISLELGSPLPRVPRRGGPHRPRARAPGPDCKDMLLAAAYELT